MEIEAVLVTLQNGDATCGVVRSDDGMAWVTSDVGRGAASSFTGAGPTAMGLEDRTLVGGLLPDGAVGAQVTDARGRRVTAEAGGGAWLALLDHHLFERDVAVCFPDGAGGMARPDAPAAPPTAVVDADEPCPACDGTVWEAPASATLPLAGELLSPVVPAVTCGRCGYTVGGGSSVVLAFPAAAGAVDPDPQAALRHRLHRDRLRDVAFPLKAPEGLAVVFSGSGGPGGGAPPTRVRLSHVDTLTGTHLTVETDSDVTRAPFAPDLAARRLEGLIEDAPAHPPERSPAGLAVWREAHRRARTRAIARATRLQRTLHVDGMPRPFAVIDARAAWAATAHLDNQVLTVVARGIAPEAVRLRTLTDPRHADPGPADDDLPPERFRPLR